MCILFTSPKIYPSLIKVRKAKRKGVKGDHICFLSALGTAAALTLLALYLIRQKQIDDEDWFANYPTHDCRGDGFKGIYYNFTNRRGIQVRR